MIPANMLIEMKGQDRIYSVLESDLSTTLRFAEHPIASDSLGMYLPYLVSGALPAREADTVNFSFNSAKASASVFDEDRAIQKELGGASRKAIRGRAIRWKLVSPFLDVADHLTLFDGVISNYGMSAERTYNFELSPKISEFDSQFNMPVASTALFPSIPDEDGAEFKDTDLWIVYGKHVSSSATGSDGMIQCTPMGEADLWIVSLGAVEEVLAVYEDGTRRDNDDWTEILVARGNHNISTIRFTATAPPVTDTITVDVKGLTNVPTGTGTMISNPMGIARNLVANFVYNDGTTANLAAWAEESGLPMNTTILDAAEEFYDIRNLTASAQIFSSNIPRTVLAGIGKDWNAAPFFTIDNKFAMRPEDPSETDLYKGVDSHIIDRVHPSFEFRGMETARQTPVTKLNVSYLLKRSGGGFIKTVQVADKDITPELIESLQMTTSRASVF